MNTCKSLAEACKSFAGFPSSLLCAWAAVVEQRCDAVHDISARHMPWSHHILHDVNQGVLELPISDNFRHG